MESLAPESENPFAKLVMLNTPQDPNDISQQALKDKAFVSVRYGCWTHDTENLPLEFRKSAWEERISTAKLQEEYRDAQARNRLSIFIREKECKLATPETSAFKPEWLRYFGEGEDYPEPDKHLMWIIMVIDPVPPPSDEKLEKGVIDGDFEAISVLGRYKGDIYLLETVQNRGHAPDWTVREFFRLGGKWGIRKCIVETVAYQKTLVWLLREAMRVRQVFYLVEEFGRSDKRPKVQKIYDGLHPIVSTQRLYVRRDQIDFIDQYTNFSTVRKIAKDDTIETVAIGCTELQNKGISLPGGGEPSYNEDDYENLGDYRGAP
jgi:hypothetical protein